MDFEREIVRVYFTLMNEAGRYCRDGYASDLAAEAVTRALEHRDSYDGRHPLIAWCRAIMRNLWLNGSRRLESVNTVRLGDFDCPGGATPDAVVEAVEAMSVVRSMCTSSVAVDTLVEFAQGFSLSEISARRGVPVGTVKRRIHDGRVILRTHFKTASVKSRVP